MLLAKRVQGLSASLTLEISSKAKKMKSEGIDVVGFGAGEPDFDTPLNIKEKAKQAIDQGFTKYTPASGTLELKNDIIKKLKNDNLLEYSTEEIIVGTGAKYVIFEAILSLVDEGDEVIIPSPYWLSYPDMVKVAGGKSVFIETLEENGFKVTPEELKKAITAKTKIFILNSPSNPTGAVYTKQELDLLRKVLEKENIICISDEIYEKLVYGQTKHISIASLSLPMKQKTLVINGVSKAYSMTGWRIGYAAGPSDIIKAMSKLQSHSTSNPVSISQIATSEALSGDQSTVQVMVKEFKTRRDFMVEYINNTKNISCLTPDGAFYCFVNIKPYLDLHQENVKNSMDFTKLLLDKKHLAVVPGAAFGNDHYIRLSYATSMNNIKKGLERLRDFVQS